MLVICPHCNGEVSSRIDTCLHCGGPMHGAKPAKTGFGAPPLPRERGPEQEVCRLEKPHQDVKHDEPPPREQKPRVVVEKCPVCKGRGLVRDQSLLPWNNWPASGSLIIGLAGLCGSAYFNANHRALLLAGLLFSGLGIVLYAIGDRCPKCKGKKEERRVIKPKPRPKPTSPEFTNYLAIAHKPPADEPEDKPQPPHSRKSAGPRQDTNLRRRRPQVF